MREYVAQGDLSKSARPLQRVYDMWNQALAGNCNDQEMELVDSFMDQLYSV